MIGPPKRINGQRWLLSCTLTSEWQLKQKKVCIVLQIKCIDSTPPKQQQQQMPMVLYALGTLGCLVILLFLASIWILSAHPAHMDQGWQTLPVQGCRAHTLDSADHTVFSSVTWFCCCAQNCHRQYVNECAWLSSSFYLQTLGSRLHLDCSCKLLLRHSSSVSTLSLKLMIHNWRSLELVINFIWGGMGILIWNNKPYSINSRD